MQSNNAPNLAAVWLGGLESSGLQFSGRVRASAWGAGGRGARPGDAPGPPPPPGAAAWHRPTLLHPCKQTQDAERSNFSAGAAATGGRGGGPHAPRAAGVPREALAGPAPPQRPALGVWSGTPEAGRAARRGALPRTEGGRSARQPGRADAKPLASGPGALGLAARPPAALGPLARPGLAPPRPLNPGPFIGQPHPCQRDGDRVPAGKTSLVGSSRKIKS